MTIPERPARLLLAASIVVVCGARSGAPADPAEYAVRWNPAEGGPKTSSAILCALDDTFTGDVDEYEIRYFDVKAPADAPAHAKTILRRRVKNGTKHELTLKYRGDDQLASPSCALPEPDESKSEVDVTVTSADEPRRAFSFSCTVKSKTGPIAPPPALEAHPRPCGSTMRRRETKRLKAKVEEWRLPNGTTMMEVSREGHDTTEELAAFKDKIVALLLDAGIRPLDASKTELGSDCP